MAKKQVIDFDAGTLESLEIIFSALTVGSSLVKNPDMLARKRETYQEAMREFISQFTVNVFYNEYYFLYQLIRVAKITNFGEAQISSEIEANSADILSSPFIEVVTEYVAGNGNVISDDEKVEYFREVVLERVNKLANREVTMSEFLSACEQYKRAYKNQVMLQTANAMSMIMQSTGYDEPRKRGGVKHLQGYLDASDYYSRQSARIRELDNESGSRAIVIDNDWVMNENERDKSPEDTIVLDYGIEELDKVCRGIRRTNMLNIIGPTKGGKTTFTCYMVHRALKRGLNVAIWALEGTYSEWMAQLIALTALDMRKEGDVSVIQKSDILHQSYKTDEVRVAVGAARQHLVSGAGMGKLSFIGGAAYIEDYIDTIDNHRRNENKFDVIVVDSPVLVVSRTGRTKVDRAGEAFTSLKNYVANQVPEGAVAIVTAQLKQDVVNSMRANKDQTLDVTVGAETSETIKTPDEVIGLFSSKEERLTGKMKIYNIAARHHETFRDCYIGCDMSCGTFFSQPELNEG
jgi:hypothetical protein